MGKRSQEVAANTAFSNQAYEAKDKVAALLEELPASYPDRDCTAQELREVYSALARIAGRGKL